MNLARLEERVARLGLPPDESGLSRDQLKELRTRAQADLLVFAREVLGLDLLDPEIHGPIAEFLTGPGLRKVIQLPRQCYKSSLCAVAFPLWLLAKGKAPSVRGIAGEDLRILVASSTQPLAEAFLREASAHIERSDLFKALYGELRDPRRWSQSKKTIRGREAKWKEASLTAVGRGTALTGGHYDVAILDDVVSELDRDSDTERAATLSWYRALLSVVCHDGLVVLIGTRWHASDLYAHLLEELNPQLAEAGKAPYMSIVRPAYKDDGEPAFPNILGRGKLEALRVELGSLAFSAQYELRPLPAEATLFSESELRYYDDLPEGCTYFGYLDPSLGRTKRADYSAFVVIARDPAGLLYLVEADLQRRAPERLKTDIVAHFGRYPFERVGIETNAFQEILALDIEADLARAGHPHRLVRVNHSADCISRVQAAQGRIMALQFPRDWRARCPEAMRQLFEFPLGRHDDGPDAIEGALSILLKGGTSLLAILQANLGGTREPSAVSPWSNDHLDTARTLTMDF